MATTPQGDKMRLTASLLKRIIKEEIEAEIPSMTPAEVNAEQSLSNTVKQLNTIINTLFKSDGKQKRSEVIKMSNDLLSIRDTIKDMIK